MEKNRNITKFIYTNLDPVTVRTVWFVYYDQLNIQEGWVGDSSLGNTILKISARSK